MQTKNLTKTFLCCTDCDKRVKPTRHDNRPVAQLKKNVKGHNGGK